MTVSVAGTALSSSVDASGAFEFGGVPPGDVRLVFGSPDAPSMTCTGSGVATAGQYRNVGTVVATADGNIYRDTDESFYFGQAPEEPEKEKKVELCHRTGNGSYHLIDVSVNAEPAHRAHGDAKVGEAVPGNAGRVFTASCSVR